ncbi:MAG: gamma-glutamyltransferase [Paracoccaceae bacterium]
MRTITIVFITLIANVSLVWAQTRSDPEAATGLRSSPLVKAERQMIVAANPLASQAGAKILRDGGSAADAMIATLLVLNVVEPQSSGIGGGAFALVDGPQGITSFDARETAPVAATPDLFLENGEPLPFIDAVLSGKSVGVPGLVRLMGVLHEKYGTLPWGRLFDDAIALAENGFPVSPRLAGLLDTYQSRLNDTAARKLFLSDGTPLVAGDMLLQPHLAATFRMIAANGADAFYTGALASEIVAAVDASPRPGALAVADLANYKVIEREPVCHPFRDYEVCGMGPPSSGATTVGQILMLLDRFKPDELYLDGARLWHLFGEASRLAYADRARYLADSDFLKVPLRGLLDPSYITGRSLLIDPIRASTTRAVAGEPPWRDGSLNAPDTRLKDTGTTHVSVIDSNGLTISLTASIETAFGSQRMAGGFLLNNQLTDFSFLPDRDGVPIANAVAPGKRPRSSMSPTIVLKDGKPVVITGSPGGSRIPEYVAQNLVAILGYAKDPAEAAALPHVSQRNRDTLAVEPFISNDIKARLTAFGHRLDEREMTSGVHTIVVTPDGTLLGGADPRREGLAVGD